MVDTLKRLKPRRVQDLIAVSALYRPGPMENIPTYIRRHHGQEPVDYSDFPKAERHLAPILAETYGIPVYQEQIMQIAQAVAGYSLGEADLLRRAMGKKKVEEMERHRSIFQAGAEKNGIPREESARIFDLLERFANYGFNKSHSAAYGVLSYQTAYLKAHYPVEFAAALLTVERGDSDKVAQYVVDARHQGVEVLSPDINASRGDFTPVGGVVRFGLYAVKNVGENAVDHIVQERERRGPFTDLFDFCRRVDTTLVNKRAVEHLIKAGAFDALVEADSPPTLGEGGRRGARARNEAPGATPGGSSHRAAQPGRQRLLANLDTAMKWGAAQREHAALGQMSLFGVEEVAPPAMEPGASLTDLEMLRFEKEALGLYLSAHPMGSYPGLAEAASCRVDEVERAFRAQAAPGGGRVKVVLTGLLQNVAKRPTRKGGMMARFEVADESGGREVVAFGRTYDEVAPLLEEDAPVVAVIDVTEDGESVRLIASRLIRWDQRGEGGAVAPEVALLSFDLADVAPHQLLELRSMLDEHAGRTPVRLDVAAPQGRVLYQVDGVRVDAASLAELEASCPWLTTRVTVDRQALLAERGNGFGPRAAPPAVEVPF